MNRLFCSQWSCCYCALALTYITSVLPSLFVFSNFSDQRHMFML